MYYVDFRVLAIGLLSNPPNINLSSYNYGNMNVPGLGSLAVLMTMTLGCDKIVPSLALPQYT